MPNNPAIVLAIWTAAYLAVGLALEAFYRLIGRPTPARYLPYALTVGTFKAISMLALLGCTWLAITLRWPRWEWSWRFDGFLADQEQRDRQRQ